MRRIYIIFACIVSVYCFLPIKAEIHKGQWITASESQNTTNLWMCFRHDFNVENIPSVALTRIAVDSKYWLWLNGKLVVFEGGVKRGPTLNDTYYDQIDIAPYLNNGTNTIAILLWYFGKEGFSHNPSGKAALFVECNSDSCFSLVSSQEWKSCVHPAYFTAAYPMPNFRLPESNILYDARYAIDGWQEPSYLAKEFKASVNLGIEGVAPWNKLEYRIIPQWKNYGLTNYFKTELRQGNSEVDTLVCFLPYNAQITPYFKVESDKNKKIIIQTDHYNGGGPYNIRAEYITKEGLQEYESFGWMNGHIVYYIVPKNIKIIELKYRETSYNTDFAGSFECNDPFLNRLWEKSRRTLIVTMRDTYMDCPDRERAQWWGDVVIESGEAFYALCPKSHLLMKKGMYELIGWQRNDGTLFSPIPSSNFNKELPGQMLAAIGYYGFWNYYLNTGDKQTIQNLYKGVVRYLNLWELTDDGVIKFRSGDWTWGDWGINIDKEVLYNAFYYLALKGAAEMAQHLSMQEDVIKFTKKMKVLKIGFNKNFWNGKAYRHPAYNGETDDRVHGLAVVSGLADVDMYPAILEVLKTQEYASPYTEKYVIEALFLMGKGDYGLKRMKRRFAEMVNDPYRTTLYEGWGVGAKGFGGGTVNHAWSGGGLTILSQYVSGVSPVEPAYKLFKVMPQPAGLDYAKAIVPTVSGLVCTSFKNENKRFQLYVNVPSGTAAIVGIPYENVKLINCNGKQVWKKGNYISNNKIKGLESDGSYIKFKVKEGDYNFSACR